MRRIHFTGASGSGTTTLGRAVAEALGWAHVDTDDLFWEATDPPFLTPRPREARIERLDRVLATTPELVLSGSATGWGDAAIATFDLIVWLTLPHDVRMARLAVRERVRYGAAIDPGGRMHTQHQEFLAWAAAYDEGPPTMRSRALHEAWVARQPAPVLRLDADRSLEALAAEVLVAVRRA